MICIEPRTFHTSEKPFVAANAKVVAQQIRLAAMSADDPQRTREESLLRSMINNASAARLVVSIGHDR